MGPHEGPTISRCHLTKFSRPNGLTPGICSPFHERTPFLTSSQIRRIDEIHVLLVLYAANARDKCQFNSSLPCVISFLIQCVLALASKERRSTNRISHSYLCHNAHSNGVPRLGGSVESSTLNRHYGKRQTTSPYESERGKCNSQISHMPYFQKALAKSTKRRK